MTLKNISLLILGAVVVSLLVVTPYYLGISGGDGLPSLSSKNQDWGAFGSYFGGVLGPILSAASILFVWWQGKTTASAQQDQISQIKKQVSLQAISDLQKTYDMYLKRLADSLELTGTINLTYNAHGLDIEKICFGEVVGRELKVSEILPLYGYIKSHPGELSQEAKAALVINIKEGMRDLMGHLLSNVEIIASYLNSYDSFDESFQLNTYNHLVKDFDNYIDNTAGLREAIEFLEIELPITKH